MEDFDLVIIGAGVVGLSITYFLSSLSKNILVIEKNSSFGMETSSRNSEGIHSGIYYPENSYKAKLCVRGRKLLYEFVIGMTLGILKLVNLLW
jgi:L-2-hydroxyglutarate oxidase LhgO